MTEASARALEGLRDPRSMQWFAIPLLALVFYVYATEIRRARTSGDWNGVFAGLALFGMDCVNEAVNGWVLALSGRSALWTAPGPTALRIFVGWNLEIALMFAVAGIVWYRTLSGRPGARIAGVPEPWFWAAAYSAFCVGVELFLNRGGLLVWEYAFWNGTLKGVWLIFLFGYFHFYVATILVVGAKAIRTKLVAVGAMYLVAIAMHAIGLGAMGWTY